MRQTKKITYVGDRSSGEEGKKQAKNSNIMIITNQLTHGGQGHGMESDKTLSFQSITYWLSDHRTEI